MGQNLRTIIFNHFPGLFQDSPGHLLFSRTVGTMSEDWETQVVLGGHDNLLLAKVEAEGLAGEGHQPVPSSLSCQALKAYLLPVAGGVVQKGSPHLAVHHKGQLLLSERQGLLQGERGPQLGVEVSEGTCIRELSQEVGVLLGQEVGVLLKSILKMAFILITESFEVRGLKVVSGQDFLFKAV